MKTRVIFQGLSHEPEIAVPRRADGGVDVELRRDMWALVRGLRENA